MILTVASILIADKIEDGGRTPPLTSEQMKKFGIQTPVETISNNNGFSVQPPKQKSVSLVKVLDNGVTASVERNSISRPKVIRRTSFNEENHYRNWCERTLDVFEIIGKIGEGSYGQVYKAKDKVTGKISSLPRG